MGSDASRPGPKEKSVLQLILHLDDVRNIERLL